ncbi:TonB-dependent receptor [Dinghuibacter silviterrae]|uniref:Iron complex outermembrane receptor protein n=1 Tax=Dinghuibacter silviterrae TaxID=1539049 RepID=A0A4R8DS99_9BACT|nr:TonB-dependent receptor [Dinghuibacter silviterrae]TDX00718.1 iron complex outermembrane receptor protein [Dinghuibacter silviterrae]
MKKLFWAMCCFVSPLLPSAQVLLHGTVTDSVTHEPLEGVSLRLERTGGGLSDQDGIFRIKAPKPGEYLLTASEVGYKTQTLTVRLDAATTEANISLSRLHLFLQPIEVKAVRVDDKAPFSTTNLGKKEIAENNVGQDIPYLLDQTPSVVINSNSGNGVGYTGLSIRGVDQTRINVTLNGIPMNDAEDQGVYFVDLPDLAGSISSMQIQRGVGTSTNGAGAFGATINLSTNEVNDKAYGEVDNSVGSYNTWKTMVKAGSGLIDDHFTLEARVSRITSLGYVDRGSSDLKSIYLSAAYLTEKSSLRFNFIGGTEKTYQTWNGVPGAKLFGSQADLQQYYDNNIGSSFFTPEDSVNLFKSDRRKYNYFTYPNQTDNYWQNYYQLFYNHTLSHHWDLNTAAFLTRGWGYYVEYSPQQSFSAYGLSNPVFNGDTITTTDLIQQLWLNNWFYGGIASLQYHSGNDQVIAGGGWDRYDGEHYGIVTWAQVGFPNDYQYYWDVAHKTDWNAYVKWQHRFSRTWSSFIDLQDRVITYYINGFDDNPGLYVHKDFNFFNPKAGISYTGAGGWNGYLSVSMAGHEPNRSDFEANEAQQPKAEHLLDLEASLGQKTRTFSWNATAYYMRYKDQLVLTGKINDVGEYTRTNIPDSYRAGLELQGGLKLTRWFSASANLTLSQNKVLNFTEYLTDYDNGTQHENQYHSTDIALSPDVIGGATLDFTPVRSLKLSLLSKYVGRQYLDNTSKDSRSLDPFFYENAQVLWTVPQPLFKQVQVSLMAYNIFNALYEPNGYTSSYISNGQVVTSNFYFPAAPVNYMVSVNIAL